MADQWDFYFSQVNDAPASLFIDFAQAEIAPDEHRPWLLWAWVYLNDPDENGLTTRDEHRRLGDVEEAVMEAVEDACGGEMVGRITTAGRYEMYFYGPSFAGFEEAVAVSLAARFPDYRFDTGYENDPDWNHYQQVLYPSPHEVQQIKNRQVLQVLLEEGDALETPRCVSHWAYFPDDATRRQFAADVSSLGFRVLNETNVTDDAGNNRCGIVFEREHAVDWNTINEVTVQLHDLAITGGGEYDGWETPVVKGEDQTEGGVANGS